MVVSLLRNIPLCLPPGPLAYFYGPPASQSWQTLVPAWILYYTGVPLNCFRHYQCKPIITHDRAWGLIIKTGTLWLLLWTWRILQVIMKSHGRWNNNIIIHNSLNFISIVLLLLFVMNIMKWRKPTWIE